MTNLKIVLFFLCFLVLIGCDNNRPATESINLGQLRLEDEEQAIKFKSDPNTQPENSIERKLIKTGHLEFETEDLSKTQEDILQAIRKYNGYIVSENEFKNLDEISNIILIRVPADKFDNLIQDIFLGIERFDRKEINVQDVTEEFLDVEARLKTKKELENRYLEILKQATSVSEILEVEKQIGELRSEIESIEGRLKYLKNQVSLSTLTVRIYEQISTQTEFGEKFENGFKNGWENLILFFVFLVNIWPFILILVGVFILIRILRKRKRNSN